MSLSQNELSVSQFLCRLDFLVDWTCLVKEDVKLLNAVAELLKGLSHQLAPVHKACIVVLLGILSDA